MMRSERKTEKWRIPGKWTLIFLLILLAFYGYQNILAENYERQVVSWIGQTEKDRTVSAFTEPDEEAYQKEVEQVCLLYQIRRGKARSKSGWKRESEVTE